MSSTMSDTKASSDTITIKLSLEKDKLSLDAIIDAVLTFFLAQCGHNKVRAAQLLKVHRNIFYRRQLGRTTGSNTRGEKIQH